MINPQEIEKQILIGIPDARVEVVDLTGTQDHFQAVVISSSFEGKTMVEQHQLVYKALGDLMREAIHALALKTFTPQQWKNS